MRIGFGCVNAWFEARYSSDCRLFAVPWVCPKPPLMRGPIRIL